MCSFAWWLSLTIGFLSLSQEILWVRIAAFTMRGSTYAFSAVLLLFLSGIALGASVGKRWCGQRADLYRLAALTLGAAAVLDLSLVPVLALLRTPAVTIAVPLILVFFTATLKSVLFPIAHHLGSRQSGPQLGRSVSKVYFGNILGSALGPIVTGYVLLDYVPLEGCLFLIGAGSATLALLCARRAHVTRLWRLALPFGLVFLVSWRFGADGLVRQLASHTLPNSLKGGTVKQVVETRHGIIHTVALPGHPETILGGNAYDGKLAVDLQANENGLDRAVALLAVHPRPERALIIGMGGGAWIGVISSSPTVREIVVVELNKGYRDMIRRYPGMAAVLSDPRVKITIDDGRRWLRRHPEDKFDLIVANTTQYWRAYTTNLLSREYFRLMARHLRPGGIVGVNSTGSADVLRTAAEVFAHVERRASFVYGSDRPFAAPRRDVDEVMRALRFNDRPVFDQAAFDPGGLARELSTQPFLPAGERFSGLRFNPAIVTDANLMTEQAHGRWDLYHRFPGVYRWVDRMHDAMSLEEAERALSLAERR